MSDLKDLIAYICWKYPFKNELSKTRLTKLVYLADWKCAIDRKEQLTPIKWYFDNYGPFAWDVWEAAQHAPSLFKIQKTLNIYGDKKEVLTLKPDVPPPQLLEYESQIIDFVIEATKMLAWESFISLIYSTYPIISSHRYSLLDLVAKAEEYNKQSSD